MANKRQKMTMHDFYCTKCGNKGLNIMRKDGQLREPGHLKKLYCLFCKEEVNHAEVRDIGQKYSYEDFRQEFELGRFVDGIRVPIAELMGCSCDTCPFNVNGKCWNANNSEKCPHKPKMEG